MTDENLGNMLDEGYRSHQRAVAIKNLGGRTHLSLGQIATLCAHPQHGEIVATITLDELLAIRNPPTTETSDDEAPVKAKRGPKPKADKAAKATKSAKATKATKAPKADKVAKAPKAVKTPKAAKADKGGAKADKGKPKPRLDYDRGMKEVLAALKAAKEPVGRSAIERSTGFTGVQIRAFAKKLVEEGKIQVLGDGGRSTKYASL